MLTARQSRFVDEYVASLNGTQAAIRAGYSRHSARSIACENLKKPEIAAEISRCTKEISDQDTAIRVAVRAALARIAFATPPLLPDGTIKEPKDWTLEEWDAVAYYSASRKYVVRSSDQKHVPQSQTLRMKDKLKALELLGQLVGLFPSKRKRRH